MRKDDFDAIVLGDLKKSALHVLRKVIVSIAIYR